MFWWNNFFEGLNFINCQHQQNSWNLSTSKKPTTINWEIFVYENIHVLNIRVNIFSRMPHKNILTRKFVKLKLCTYRQLSDY